MGAGNATGAARPCHRPIGCSRILREIDLAARRRPPLGGWRRVSCAASMWTRVCGCERWRLLHEPAAVGEDDGLNAVAQAQLGEDVVDVGLDRGVAEDEALGDLGVAETVGDQRKNLEFARAELVEFGRTGA